jgi:hypothetical protein
MNHFVIRFMLGCILALSSHLTLAQTAGSEAGQDGKKLTLQMSPYTFHFSEDPNHRRVVMVGLEREYANQKLDGVVLFSNSFGQESVYVYPWGGVYKNVWGVKPLSFKWTAGAIWGYRGEHKDEVLNFGGIAPAVIIGMAYEFKPGWSAQLNLLGGAALQFQLNAPLN